MNTCTKITNEVIVNTLISVFKERNYHEDFQKQNQKKIELLNKYLFDDNNIQFIDKKFIFKTKKENINVNYINIFINEILEKITQERELGKGELCTTENIVQFKEKIGLRFSNKVIRSHEEQIQKEYKNLIKESIMYLFYTSFTERKQNKRDLFFKINTDMSEEDSEIFEQSLDELDYF